MRLSETQQLSLSGGVVASACVLRLCVPVARVVMPCVVCQLENAPSTPPPAHISSCSAYARSRFDLHTRAQALLSTTSLRFARIGARATLKAGKISANGKIAAEAALRAWLRQATITTSSTHRTYSADTQTTSRDDSMQYTRYTTGRGRSTAPSAYHPHEEGLIVQYAVG